MIELLLIKTVEGIDVIETVGIKVRLDNGQVVVGLKLIFGDKKEGLLVILQDKKCLKSRFTLALQALQNFQAKICF